MFVQYDPVFRCLTGTHAVVDPVEARERMTAEGKSFVEVEGALPGDFEMLAVDEEGGFVVREPLPEAARLPDMTFDVAAVMPDIPDLPAGAVVEPPVGAPLPSGITTVMVRAPYHLDHQFLIRVHTAEDERRDLIAHAAQRRWEAETGGFTFRGHPIPSDDRCALKVTRALEAARYTPGWSTTWECADGAALPLAVGDIAELDTAFQAHHDAVFARFSAVKARIEVGKITTRENVDAAMGGTSKES